MITGCKSFYDLCHKGLSIRYEPVPGDVKQIMDLVEATGFFRPDEIEIAGELVQEHLENGPEESGYYFVIASKNGRVAGYGCYGPIPCTLTSYDIYWIAVSPDFQGKGLGKIILTEMERLIFEAGGKRAYVETSTQIRYASTRNFYERCGYRCDAILDDFYEPGDGKAIYSKMMGSSL
ncbi:MAG: GNAT family N-acetyltransferase [Desulfobacterales bacterium RIFOXYA12_FULL_46_15]|nr:MAG: GNAT family N-acetyltransferase [Desulfobacula sp. GWF2_41_7]OGR22881.1 MAG: GNAT family N-acetyltransferase [Desulfobacterales bacterium RIFOXYA12_FULL_46_15]